MHTLATPNHRYVPGKAPSPMANVGLPVEAPNQDQLEYWTENPEEVGAEYGVWGMRR